MSVFELNFTIEELTRLALLTLTAYTQCLFSLRTNKKGGANHDPAFLNSETVDYRLEYSIKNLTSHFITIKHRNLPCPEGAPAYRQAGSNHENGFPLLTYV
jgi:hypothetical protein